MLYADDAGVVSLSPEQLRTMMGVIVVFCTAFDLTVSEAKTEIVCLRTKGMPESIAIFSEEAAGQVYSILWASRPDKKSLFYVINDSRYLEVPSVTLLVATHSSPPCNVSPNPRCSRCLHPRPYRYLFIVKVVRLPTTKLREGTFLSGRKSWPLVAGTFLFQR